MERNNRIKIIDKELCSAYVEHSSFFIEKSYGFPIDLKALRAGRHMLSIVFFGYVLRISFGFLCVRGRNRV